MKTSKGTSRATFRGPIGAGLLACALALLAGCGGADSQLAAYRAAPAEFTVQAASTPHEGAGGWCANLPIEITPPARPPSEADSNEDPQPPAPDGSAAEPGMPLSYEATTNTIKLGADAPTTLPELDRALGRPDLLKELSPGEWLLAANLRIGQGATLYVGGPEAYRLKLRSDASGFVWIKAIGGQLTFADTCVTSWDAGRSAVDDQVDDGRSFVLARDGARMDIHDSELSYLGYNAAESYGVAWRLAGTTGSATGSRFGHNYYGLYSYEASGLAIRGNEVHHSARYGIDPHTRSSRLVIEDNIAHHNGKHGIILAEECGDSVVRGNIVYANALHGIVIYQRSSDNLVVDNTSYGNGRQGINVNDSSSNTIRGNTVYDNADAGIGVGQGSAGNAVVDNTVRDNRQDGIYLFSGASGNIVRGNIVTGNARHGIYAKSPGNTVDSSNQAADNGADDVRSGD